MDDIDLESFGKKKKKKKRGEGLDDLGDVKEALPEAEEDDMDLDLDSFGTKKKKKKKKKHDLDNLDDADEDKENEGDISTGKNIFINRDTNRTSSRDYLCDEIFLMQFKYFSDPWTGSDRDYQYDELLDRVFGIMRDKNPEMVGGKQKKFVMRPPQVQLRVKISAV